MLSLKELKRAAPILERMLADSVLQRVVQPDEFSVALAFRMRAGEAVVMLSCRAGFARISAVREMPKGPDQPFSFAQYLRAHLSRAAFGGVTVSEDDRQATIRLLSQEGSHELVLSILGSRSNLYLLDRDGKLVHALRPLDQTRPELVLGGQWTRPPGTLRSEGTDRWEAFPEGEYLEAIEQHYRGLEYGRQIDAWTRRIENVLAREEGFLARKHANLQEDLAEARRAEEYKQKGELLKSVLHQIRPGDSSVSAKDYDTGETVVIPLDAALTPAENLEAYFGRYQKELRGTAAIEQQLESVRSYQAALGVLRTGLRKILEVPEPDLEALEKFSELPPMRRLLNRYHPRPRKEPAVVKAGGAAKSVPGRLLPKRYNTPDGLEIWVGRSDESNDYLTTRLARGNDLFFHLEGYPGSHVILRTEGRTDPPPASMLAACELAVHFSKLKNAGRADVHVAYIKDVKKPKGVKKGLVYVTRGKTIHLRRDSKRLEDVLSSRIDE